jgi:hypothetical protein
MNTNSRRILMGLMIAVALGWAFVLIGVFVATKDIAVGWLLTTILLYVAMFVFALLLLFYAAPADTTILVARRNVQPSVGTIGADHESVFESRRGVVEIDRTRTGAAEVTVAEPGRSLHLEQAEAVLDRLEPVGAEAMPRPTSDVVSEGAIPEPSGSPNARGVRA